MQNRLWSDFSYVASSGYREKVITALMEKPKLPKQVAQETNLRLVHVSRALRELGEKSLVECLTPGSRRRGRVYALTPFGSQLLRYMNDSNQRFIPPPQRPLRPGMFVPKIRASSFYQCILIIQRTKGEAALREALRRWSVDLDGVSEDMWLSVDAVAQFLELIEERFGDGSYTFVKNIYRQAAASIPSIKELLHRIVPLRALAERAPIVYNKEWNYGRMEVKAERNRATFMYFDWMPTPGMCSMVQGVLEGVLMARKVPGTVTKIRCARQGDSHCEYVAEWEEKPTPKPAKHGQDTESLASGANREGGGEPSRRAP